MVLEDILNYISENRTEVFAVVTGLIFVILNTRQLALAWLFGILSVIPYILIFWKSSLYGDFVLHIYYLLTSFYGWWNWKFGSKEAEAGDRTLKVTILIKEAPRLLLTYAAACLALTFAFGYVLSKVHLFGWDLREASFPYADGFTTIFSLLGQWLLARKRLENWIVWLLVDVVAMFVYWQKELYATSVLYGLYLVLASYGLWAWYRSAGRDSRKAAR